MTFKAKFAGDEPFDAKIENNAEFSASFSGDTPFNARFGGDIPFQAKFSSDDPFKARFQSIQRISTDTIIMSDTTEHWNSDPTLISDPNVVYIYVDHQTKTDEHGNEVWIPGLKIGDGKAYLIDLPFTDDIMVAHVNDLGIHVTAEEKAFWDNKVRAYIDTVEGEQLVFTTH